MTFSATFCDPDAKASKTEGVLLRNGTTEMAKR